MSIIGVVSMKGGVGKTSVSANLAGAMATLLGAGHVSVLDLDPQNGLHWHLGLEDTGTTGVCEQSLRCKPWLDVAAATKYGVTCLPYGTVDEPDRKAFEALLLEQPDWVGAQLEKTGLDEAAVIVIDTPPGPSVYLKQVFACADLILIVLLADAGSYATIPAMESWLADAALQRPGLRSAYVLNQVDRSETLNRDVSDMLHQHLGARLVTPGIHSDETVAEALAFQQPVLVYDPHGQATNDLTQLATWAIDMLNQ